MKPCDCKDMFDAINKLTEIGVKFNSCGIQISPPMVLLYCDLFTVKFSQVNFKRFAEWYLEDQEKEAT